MPLDRRLLVLAQAGIVMTLLALLATLPMTAFAATANPEPVSDPESHWGANYFPNVPLVTQNGQSVRFFDDLIKDKVVAINFIYTTCSASCSMETARLREVQRLLGERMGRDIHFISISIDPKNDSPRVLKQYAELFKVGPGWTFLTGKTEDITLLRQKLGLYLPDDAKDASDHNLSLIVGNQKNGLWKKVSPFENPHVIAEVMGGQLHNWKYASQNSNSYANAPTRLPELSRGHQLFRSRCSSCHTIGAPADSPAALQAIGPDLAGVTERRERAWLARWIKAPDRMLADQDPIALHLYEQYNRFAMPNLKLNDLEIEALIDYLRDEAGQRGKFAALE